MPYVQCMYDSSQPRLDVRICKARCDRRDKCEEYIGAVILYDLAPDVPLDDFDPLAGTPIELDPLTGLCEINPLKGA